MIVWLYVRWWYSAGWQWAWSRAVTDRTKRCAEFFSVIPLLQTLFSPFKQTATGQGGTSIGEQFRAFIDRLISRIIGAIVRSFVIIAGLFCLLFILLSGLLFVALWPLLPLSFIVAMALFITGAGV